MSVVHQPRFHEVLSGTFERSPASQSRAAGFPALLREIVDNGNREGVILWEQEGHGFLIRDRSHFDTKILPRYFPHTKPVSFYRQLCCYGFEKKTTKRDSCDCLVVTHPYFHRDHPELLQYVRRDVPPPTLQDLQSFIDAWKERYRILTEQYQKARAEREELEEKLRVREAKRPSSRCSSSMSPTKVRRCSPVPMRKIAIPQSNFRLILDTLSATVVILSHNDEFVAVNTAYTKRTGYSMELLADQRLRPSHLLHLQLTPSAGMTHLARESGISCGEMEMVCSDGERVRGAATWIRTETATIVYQNPLPDATLQPQQSMNSTSRDGYNQPLAASQLAARRDSGKNGARGESASQSTLRVIARCGFGTDVTSDDIECSMGVLSHLGYLQLAAYSLFDGNPIPLSSLHTLYPCPNLYQLLCRGLWMSMESMEERGFADLDVQSLCRDSATPCKWIAMVSRVDNENTSTNGIDALIAVRRRGIGVVVWKPAVPAPRALSEHSSFSMRDE